MQQQRERFKFRFVEPHLHFALYAAGNGNGSDTFDALKMRTYIRIDDMTGVFQITVVRKNGKRKKFPMHGIENGCSRFRTSVRKRFVAPIDNFAAFGKGKIGIDIPMQFDDDKRKSVARYR